NAFSPNDDGINDIFRITGLPGGNITKFSLQIFDRWGRRLFFTNDPLEGWNGKCNGEACPGGVYAWIITYDDDKTRITNKGTIMILK
ncbi:MAG: gliding motility-associated C-terminal domain-containing protein, partial [Syntrophothermus sp.]